MTNWIPAMLFGVAGLCTAVMLALWVLPDRSPRRKSGSTLGIARSNEAGVMLQEAIGGHFVRDEGNLD